MSLGWGGAPVPSRPTQTGEKMETPVVFEGNCPHCGHRYADTDRCCIFCGGQLPAREKLSYRLSNELNISSASVISCAEASLFGLIDWRIE